MTVRFGVIPVYFERGRERKKLEIDFGKVDDVGHAPRQHLQGHNISYFRRLAQFIYFNIS